MQEIVGFFGYRRLLGQITFASTKDLMEALRFSSHPVQDVIAKLCNQVHLRGNDKLSSVGGW